jgi:hypothetical protein
MSIFLGYSNVGARFVYGSDLIDKGVFAFQVCIFCFCIENIGFFCRCTLIIYITIFVSRSLVL